MSVVASSARNRRAPSGPRGQPLECLVPRRRASSARSGDGLGRSFSETGIPNRRNFRAAATAAANSSSESIGLVIADITGSGKAGRASVARKCIDCGAPISETSRGRCVGCGHIPLLRERPDDFVEVLTALGSSQRTARHFKASLTAVTRWRREAGMMPHQPAVRPSRTGRLNRGSFSIALRSATPQRDMTLAGRAADFLRKFGPVYRCMLTGKAHRNGLHWNRNGYVLTDRELIERAERLGWKPREF